MFCTVNVDIKVQFTVKNDFIYVASLDVINRHVISISTQLLSYNKASSKWWWWQLAWAWAGNDDDNAIDQKHTYGLSLKWQGNIIQLFLYKPLLSIIREENWVYFEARLFYSKNTNMQKIANHYRMINVGCLKLLLW